MEVHIPQKLCSEKITTKNPFQHDSTIRLGLSFGRRRRETADLSTAAGRRVGLPSARYRMLIPCHRPDSAGARSITTSTRTVALHSKHPSGFRSRGRKCGKKEIRVRKLS